MVCKEYYSFAILICHCQLFVEQNSLDLQNSKQVEKCNSNNVRVYVDIVLNHMSGYFKPSNGTKNTTDTVTGNLTFPRTPQFKNNDFNGPQWLVDYNYCNVLKEEKPFLVFSEQNFYSTRMNLNKACKI